MKLTPEDLNIICDAAEKAAKTAGQFIGTKVNTELSVEKKTGHGSLAAQVVTEVDIQAQNLILQELDPIIHKYDLAVLAEESAPDDTRFEKNYFVCIDPLDGTLAFTEGLPGYAVSIALVSREGEPLVGVVYDPVNMILYKAVKEQGAFRNGEPWLPKRSGSSDSTLKLYLDRSFVEKPVFKSGISILRDSLSIHGMDKVEVEAYAGAVINAIRVMESSNAAYFKLPKPGQGGGSIWDFAATACMASELGLVGRSYDGSNLELNRKDSTFMNHKGVIFASSVEVANIITDIFK